MGGSSLQVRDRLTQTRESAGAGVVEQTGDRTEKVPEQVPRALLSGDLQMHLIEIDDQQPRARAPARERSDGIERTDSSLAREDATPSSGALRSASAYTQRLLKARRRARRPTSGVRASAGRKDAGSAEPPMLCACATHPALAAD